MAQTKNYKIETLKLQDKLNRKVVLNFESNKSFKQQK